MKASTTNAPVAPIKISLDVVGKYHNAFHPENLQPGNKKEKKKKGPQTIQQLYSKRLLNLQEEYKGFKIIEENGAQLLEVKPEEAVTEIKKIIPKLFAEEVKNQDGKKEPESVAMLAAFDRQYDAMLQQEEALKLSPDDDEKARLELNRAAFLYGQLDLLRRLDEQNKLLDKAEARLGKVKAAESTDSAYNFNLRELNKEDRDKMGIKSPATKLPGSSLSKTQKAKGAGKAVVGGLKYAAVDYPKTAFITGGTRASKIATANQTGSVYLPVSTFEKRQLETLEFDCKVGIRKDKQAIKQSLEGGLIDGIDIDKMGEQPLTHQIIRNSAKTLLSAGKNIAHYTIWHDSDATKDSRWRKFVEARNKMLTDIANHPDLKSAAELRKGDIEDQFNQGLIDRAEHEKLLEGIDKQIKAANEGHQKYLDALQQVVQDASKDFLKKIESDLDASDAEYKYKMVHFLLMSSIVFPVPVFGMLFDLIDPLLGGMDLGDFLASIFSVDGPLGNFAWLTDKMEIDKLVQIISDDVFGGPMTIINDTLELAEPFVQPLGQSAAGSPLSSALLSVVVEVASGGAMQKSFDRAEKARKFLPDSLEGLEDKVAAALKSRKEAIGAENRKNVGDEMQIKKSISVATKGAGWLMDKYQKNPQSCRILVENTLKDKAKASQVLEYLQAGPAGIQDLIINFYDNADGALAKASLMLRKAEENPENVKKVAAVFAFDDQLEDLEQQRQALKAKFNFQDSPGTDKKAKLADCFNDQGKLSEGFKKDKPKFIEVVVDGKTLYCQIDPSLPEADLETKLTTLKADLETLNVNLKPINDQEAQLKVQQDAALKAAVAGIKYESVKEGLETDAVFEIAQKNGIAHNHLPTKVPGILAEELKDQLADYVMQDLSNAVDNQNYKVFCGEDVGDEVEELYRQSALSGEEVDRDQLKSLFTAEATDRLLSIQAMRRLNPALHQQFLEDSKDPDFDFDEFWKLNSANLGGFDDRQTALQEEKSLRVMQCLVLEDLLLAELKSKSVSGIKFREASDEQKQKVCKKFIAEIFPNGGFDIKGNPIDDNTALEDLAFCEQDIKKLQQKATDVKERYDSAKSVIERMNLEATLDNLSSAQTLTSNYVVKPNTPAQPNNPAGPNNPAVPNPAAPSPALAQNPNDPDGDETKSVDSLDEEESDGSDIDGEEQGSSMSDSDSDEEEPDLSRVDPEIDEEEQDSSIGDSDISDSDEEERSPPRHSSVLGSLQPETLLDVQEIIEALQNGSAKEASQNGLTEEKKVGFSMQRFLNEPEDPMIRDNLNNQGFETPKPTFTPTSSARLSTANGISQGQGGDF